MRAGQTLFRLTGAVLALQLLLGGLLTFGFIGVGVHEVAGLVLLILAIATMAVWLTTKPPFKPMRILTVVIVVMIFLQIILGFATLGSGNQAISFIHFVNALLIFGATLSGTFIMLRWDQMAKAPEVHGK